MPARMSFRFFSALLVVRERQGGCGKTGLLLRPFPLPSNATCPECNETEELTAGRWCLMNYIRAKFMAIVGKTIGKGKERYPPGLTSVLSLALLA